MAMMQERERETHNYKVEREKEMMMTVREIVMRERER